MQASKPTGPRKRLDEILARYSWIVLGLTVAVFLYLAGSTANDFSQFYMGGRLILEGKSPYETSERWRIQSEILPEGEYLMPAVYPGWAYVAVVPLATLPYKFACFVWLVALSVFVAWASKCIARNGKIGNGPALALTFGFFPMILALWMGQILALFASILNLAWCCAATERRRCLGICLGILCTKPQFGLIIAGLVCFSSIRRRDFQLIGAFLVTLAALSVAGLIADARWPVGMISQIRTFSVPTTDNPFIGTTWFSVLQSCGLPRPIVQWVWGLTGLSAILFVLYLVVKDRKHNAQLIVTGTLLFFLISPYAQLYDYALLVLPLSVAYGTHRYLALFILAGSWAQAIFISAGPLAWRQVTYYWIFALLLLHDFVNTLKNEKVEESGISP